MSGRLYLLPTPLLQSDDPEEMAQHLPAVLPHLVLHTVARLQFFCAENPKTARVLIAAVGRHIQLSRPIQQLQIFTYNKNTSATERAALLEPLARGEDVGVLSEAGLPAIADPGADVVALAQQRGYAVLPLVGPCSLTLALMASGLNGQQFSFVGYLPLEAAARVAAIKRYESRVGEATQLWIETPYRNLTLMALLLATLQPNTRLVVAAQLSTPSEWVCGKTVAEWREVPSAQWQSHLYKVPAIFLIGQLLTSHF